MTAIPSLPPAPRVELGFRDGSTAALTPGSAQARALTYLASVLTQRDGVKDRAVLAEGLVTD